MWWWWCSVEMVIMRCGECGGGVEMVVVRCECGGGVV